MTSIVDSLGKDLCLEENTTASGDFETASGLVNLRKALLRRILTTPGSIVTLPDYGVGIKDFQNAPLTLGKQRELAIRIENQLPKDPRVKKVNSVKITLDPVNSSLFELKVDVSVTGLESTSFSFDKEDIV